MSLSMVYRPVQLTNDAICRSIANLRAVLPRLPVCRAHPVPVSASCCFSRFFFYYRDTGDMGPLLTFYKPGRILLERGFTDATSLRGGPAGKVRFLIASREGADMEAEEPDGSGLVTLMAEARFLVIDDYAPDVEARQITLLHVPARPILRQFLASIDTEAIESLRVAARSDFDALRKLSPIRVSQSPEWLHRVSAPLGFDSHGRVGAR